MPVVAKCPVHGVFPARHFQFMNATSTTLRGNSEPCPTCNRPSAVMDGTFDFDEHGIATVLSAPEWSVDALNEVQGQLQVLDDALSAPISNAELRRAIDEALEAIRQQNEDLAAMLESQVKGKPRAKAKAYVRNLMAAVGGAVTLAEGGKLTYEAVHLIVRQFFGG